LKQAEFNLRLRKAKKELGSMSTSLMRSQEGEIVAQVKTCMKKGILIVQPGLREAAARVYELRNEGA